MEKKLAKLRAVTFGKGGYQDAMIGITFDIGGDGWGIGDFWGSWAIERSIYSKWTESDRVTELGDVVMRINSLLEDAKVNDVSELKGTPVEVTLEGNTLKSWRVLKEVL